MATQAQILTAMRRELAPEGFARSGHTFHRIAATGFIETINLQAGLRSAAGKSTVNLGIYIPEILAITGKAGSLEEARLNKAPQECECQIRNRLSNLKFGRDQWFDRSDSGVLNTISELLVTHALPYFNKFSSLQAIGSGIRNGDLKNINVAWGTQAAIFRLLGDTEWARSVLLKERSRDTGMVDAYAKTIGVDLWIN